MNFFDYIKNNSFFKPLTSKYKRIYYDCIQILIDKAKELPVLYETDARDSIMIYLKNTDMKKEWGDFGERKEDIPERFGGSQDDSGNSGNDPKTDLQPAAIIALFRECGWLLPREIGRNGEYVVNITADCRRVLDFLRKMTERAGEGMMSNRIFAMYEIMKAAFDENSVRRERPYTNILVPMLDNAEELKDELTDLKDGIAGIMKTVIAYQDINSFGQFVMKDEMLDRFFHEYFFVKNNGLIPTQISLIKSKLRELKYSELYEKMVLECAEKLQISRADSMERIERYFAELQHFLSVEYEENMELIDSRINNYYNLANTRIMLMAENGVRLERMINDFLCAVSKMTDEEQDAVMERVSDCASVVSQKYVGYQSFERNRRLKREGANIGILSEELSEEEKRARTEHLFRSAPNHYSVERVGRFLDDRLAGTETIRMKEQPVKTKEEALMYAAAMLYARNHDFPYDVQLSEEMVMTEAADITNITISRK